MKTKNKSIINVVIENDQPVTTSRNVAENFNKRHAHVLEAIDELIGAAENSADLFYETTYIHEQNKQVYRQYYMTKDGFTLLAMGFTGKKALDFKLAYIEQFNKMEKELQKQLPSSYKESLIQLVEQIEANEILEQRVAEYEPKITYLDNILQSKDTVTITQIAADYGMSAQAMNKLLHELRVQHKVGKQWILYKKHMNEGYTKSHTTEIPKTSGGTKVVMNTKWTQKGRLFLYELLKDNDHLPQIDLERKIDNVF